MSIKIPFSESNSTFNLTMNEIAGSFSFSSDDTSDSLEINVEESNENLETDFSESNESFTPEVSGGGSLSVLDHELLNNRDAPNQHPMSAITGLEAELDGVPNVAMTNKYIESLLK